MRPFIMPILEFMVLDIEQFESLEQLRALEHGMSIYSCISKYLPVSVDVPEDLENARKIMAWS